ncbi:FAD-binding oxidoreductase [Gordonia sp. TBRC 11910]|uniref:FAD-binding oxidoreductase n=1 Tax=Gordonia asplenii TaxID=2725283 RepID=A0A848L2R2_9ACTN|nr:FAD-binding oxidoreductase [Gordonia asplenii]NMO01938.1 FAD-binding oxidoreductase [Gordonia asplenii]
MSDGALTALQAIVGAPHVLTDPDTTARYLTDWTGRRTGRASAVVRPATTDQVSDVVKACAVHGLSICPQGGNTGLVGGSVPPDDDAPRIVLSTTRLSDVEAVDEIDRCIAVGAGVTVAEIARRAAKVGLTFGIDLASRDSATAGGIVATNAGGIHMIRHGDARAQVRGVEAVLADGTVLRRWKRVVKDNVGYDLPGLLAGSEGTLAVITRVLFALRTPAASSFVLVAALDAVPVAFDLLRGLENSGLRIEAAELMTSAGVELLHERGHRRPTEARARYYVLVEVAGPADLESLVVQTVSDVAGIVDTVGEPAPARALWEIREGHTGAIAASSTTVPVKLDVSLPRASMPQALESLAALGQAQTYDCRTIFFGHIGDGNIHLNYLDVPAPAQTELADAALQLVVDAGGSVSAEHGIGRDKVRWMSTRDPADVAAMKAIRAALDPHERLNPGVLW